MKTLRLSTYLAGALLLILGCFDTASAQNAFVIGPTSLTLNTATGFSPSPSTLNVATTGNPVNFQINTTGGTNCNLNYSTSSSVASAAAPATVTVFAQTASLPSGTYQCGATFSATGLTPVTVPININVGTGGGGSSGTLSVTPSSLTLTGSSGGPAVTSTLTLTNSTPASPVTFTASAASAQGGWLQITPTTGTVTTNQQIQVQATPGQLAAGTYNGNITITPTGGAAITVPVSFTLSGNPTLQIQPNLSEVNFAYQTGTQLPQSQTLALTSSSSTQNLPVTVSVSGGSSFLVVTPTGTLQTPLNVNFSVASTAASLPPGTYTATVAISAPNASNPTTTIPVKLLVSATPLLTTGAFPTAFNYTAGGSLPNAQTVQIGSTSTAVPVSVSTSGQPWLLTTLNANQASSTSPATLTISVNPSGLAAGTYTGSVTVTSGGATNSPITIPVTLNVSASTLLSAAPGALTFTYQTNGNLPLGQAITISSSAAPLNFNVASSTQGCGSSWITLSQTTGNTGAAGSQIVVSVNPVGIPGPSVCQGTLTITGSGANNTVSIPVTLEVSSAPIVQLSQSAVTFNGQLNSGSISQVISLTSSDNLTPLQFTILNPAPWLSVSPNIGTTPISVTITANTNTLGLQTGANTATLTLTSPSLPAPVSIPVTLNITSNASLSVTPAQLSFTQATGGPTPTSQTVNVNITGGSGAQTFSASASTTFGSWLSITPSTGTAPGTITVTANGGALSPGTYNGQIVVTVPGAQNSPQTIPVTLTVAQPQTLSVSSTGLTFNTTVGATAPPAEQTFQVTSSGGPVNFTVGTTAQSCPGFLSALPSGGTTPATVRVNINITGLLAGTCSGNVTISSPGLATVSVPVSVTVAGLPTPQVTSIVNGASFIPSAIAPGEIVTLFGTNLGPATLANYVLNPDGSFATKVGDTEVLFDGVAAPIIFARTDQVAVVVPYEIAGRFQTNVQVRRTGVLSAALQQRVVDVAPGIFTVPSGGTGQGAIVNQSGVVNGSAAPATKGSVVAIYLTGAGQTSPRGVTGGVYGVNPLSTITADVTVTIGGVPAQWTYKGGAPYNIQGLYQINVTVPQNAPSGQQPVTVNVGGQPTQSGVTMFVQ